MKELFIERGICGICGSADTDAIGTGDKFGIDKGKPRPTPRPKPTPKPGS